MSERIYVATRKGLFTVDRGRRSDGSAWRITRTAFLGDHVPIVAIDSRQSAVYAALAHGHFGNKLHRSRDGGETWQEIACPEYPEPPAGAEPDLCPMSGRVIPWKLELVWALAAGGTDQPGVLWCGTIPGGLFRSGDDGDAWTMIRPLWDHPKRKKWFGGGYDYPGIHSICVDPRDSRHVTLGISCGGVWRTKDGGQNWSLSADGMRAAYLPPEQAYEPDAQDPHIIVQCLDEPDALWAQHHNGIFRTTNRCRKWEEIENAPVSSFGFATAVHPHDSKTAWFVPGQSDEKRIAVDGKVVVTRTRDGGKSFEVLRDGLPQAHAYDLTYRHALDVDERGDTLVFGTSTGSLWVSENQGDAWHCVSTHLPPIYCTRFVK